MATSGELTMITRIAVALALVLGTAQAAESVKPLRGETAVSFQCRAAHIPEVRQCTQLCEVSPDADARFECIHGCTTRGLWEMARCREIGGAADAAVASR
jgi:curli biogenesis system outer membrane secretion channel CsgG